MKELSDEEYEMIFDAIDDVADRWSITAEEAEVFLEKHGYFASINGGMVR